MCSGIALSKIFLATESGTGTITTIASTSFNNNNNNQYNHTLEEEQHLGLRHEKSTHTRFSDLPLTSIDDDVDSTLSLNSNSTYPMVIVRPFFCNRL